jgi:hypothetical protein
MADENKPNNTGRPAYPLTSKQRTYLKTGDPGASRESAMEERLEKKVNELGTRVDHLLSDIQLLADNGYLDSDHWSGAWIDFIGFDDSGYRPETDRRAPPDFENTDRDPDHSEIVEVCRVSPKPGRGRPTSAPEQIGCQLGVMFKRLMIYPDGIDESQMNKEMAWGMADGLLRGDEPAFGVIGDSRRELKQEFIEYQRNRLEREVQLDNETLQWYEESRSESRQWIQARSEMVDRTRNILYDAGLPIQSRNEDWAENLNEDLEEYHGDTRDDGISAERVVDFLIDHLVDEPDGIDDDPFIHNEPGTSGQWILFQRQYGPLEEFDPAEVVDKEDVLTIVSEKHLVAKRKLNTLVNEDTETIENAHWKNVEATEVLEQIASQDGEVRSADIAIEIGDSDDKAAVTKICTDLAGRSFERAILKGDKTGWSLTPYGELLTKGVVGGGPVGAHKSGSNETTLIDAAASQVGIEGWQYTKKE